MQGVKGLLCLLLVLASILAGEHLAKGAVPVLLPQEVNLSGKDLRVVWPTEPGMQYKLEHSTDLEQWDLVPGFPAVANGAAAQFNFSATAPKLFYRIRQLDEQPPKLVARTPEADAFGIDRHNRITVTLSDDTDIAPASIYLVIDGVGTFTTANSQIGFTNNIITFDGGAELALGDYGATVTATLYIADVGGYHTNYTWSFALEVVPEVAPNVFVFGSPEAALAGQSQGTSLLARARSKMAGKVALASSGGQPWDLHAVESDRVVVSYTGASAPVFANDSLLCNQSPANTNQIFYRKVISTSDDTANKLLTIMTAEAGLSDFIKQGSLVSSEESLVLIPDGSGNISTLLAMDGSVSLPRIGFSQDGAELRIKNASGFDLVQLNATELNWWLTPRMHAAIEIEADQVKRFQSVVSGNVTSAQVLEVGILALGVRSDFLLYDLPDAQRPEHWIYLGNIGVVPVFAKVSFDFKLKASTETKALLSFEYGKRQDIDAAFGLRYEAGGFQWIRTLQFPPVQMVPFTATINGEASLGVAIEPSMEFLIYGSAGVSASVVPSTGVTFANNSEGLLTGKMTASVSLDIRPAGPAFAALNPKPELSLLLWRDEWHLFPESANLSIYQQPQSQTVYTGEAAYFICLAGAISPLSYQWYHNGIPLPGQTSRSLLVPGVTEGHGGSYHVRIKAGGDVTNSEPAVLSLYGPSAAPRITIQPVDQNLIVGEVLQLAVTATGSQPLSYQWFHEGNPLSGQTSASLILTNMQMNQAGSYQVLVRNLSGSMLSREAVVTVNPAVSGPTGMVLIPAGFFQMGNTFAEFGPHQIPVHTLEMDGYFIDKFEVTKALWDEVKTWALTNGYSFYRPGAGKAGNHPVQTITWNDALKWCNARSEMEGRIPAYYTDGSHTTVYRSGTSVIMFNYCVKWDAGYRLPTEAEWERAARGGHAGRRFPWGTDTISHTLANYRSSASFDYDVSPTRDYHPVFNDAVQPFTNPVGYFDPNDFGVHGMAGNVIEWVWDAYDENYYSVSPAKNPRGPDYKSDRSVRGGGYASTGGFSARVYARDYRHVDTFDRTIGFRCVYPVGQP